MFRDKLQTHDHAAQTGQDVIISHEPMQRPFFKHPSIHPLLLVLIRDSGGDKVLKPPEI